MQLNYRHKNLDKLHAYARTQECLDAYRQKYRQKYQDKVRLWQALKAEGVSDAKCADFPAFHRPLFTAARPLLKPWKRGITPPSKCPKKLNKPRRGEREIEFVLQTRRENSTYGKDKNRCHLAMRPRFEPFCQHCRVHSAPSV